MARPAANSDTSPRVRILAAAAEVFAEHGFAGARVDEVALRAGVNKAMLYYHVGTKATLYAAVLGAYLEALEAGIGAALAGDEGPREQLRLIQRAFATAATTHPQLPQIMLREVAAGGATLPRPVLEKMARFIATTRLVVERGRSSGAFRADADPLVTHLLVVGSVVLAANGERLLARLGEAGLPVPPSPAGLEELAAAASDIILDGICTKGDQPCA